MLRILSRPLTSVVERYLPDPFVLVLFLTLVVMVCAMIFQGTGPVEVVTMWGDGFWSLLSFSMQMLFVLVAGYMMASTPLVRGLLARLASIAKTPGAAILLVSIVSLLASWLNWGFGLVVGALFAKELARQIKVDYRLLIAAAYSGFIIWHGGVSGSIPLSIATEDHPFADQIGLIPTSETIFSSYNLLIVVALLIVVPFVNRAMMPPEGESVYVDRAKLDEDLVSDTDASTPAEKWETSPWLSYIIGAAGLIWLAQYFIAGNGLSLNVVNFLFLTLAILLHGSPRSLLAALREGIEGGAGIVIQFPFYAGIMGIMTASGLAASVSSGMVSLANETTFAFWAFLSAGVVNFFVPSGGGQWAVQAPVVLPAAAEIGIDAGRAAMAVAWGDAWTNMIQPFWALPLLGIAGLKARDIMGFCVVHLLIGGVIIVLGLTFL
ncbi:Short-chain fatty acids transporter [Rhodobacteraceae bacterium THAF1]|uniref:short-chain fatty acid transporter n=1 Tax=Palleronia sp. THAF1 TaxID=2587842 RepID=UPI000F3AF390|nr:short-chain fatty acid transporter [Palleronia sp. THAF1]QFU09089.1 Short-chain fatty acids transporter [Palleronia sp. THAF1]VDC24110.1 Short-chain fatty acids transporter [Rhodobacteraceae bacterium THAF1]